MKKYKLFLTFFLALMSGFPFKSIARSNFVTVSLPKGISIDIPRNWGVLSSDQTITLDTTVESQLDLSKSPKVISDLVFVAGYADDTGDKAKINVRYYPKETISQDIIKKANGEDVRRFDAALKEIIFTASRSGGAAIPDWYGTKKQDISGAVALITHYRRPPNIGEEGWFNVRLVRILNGPKSFTLTVSYNELNAVYFKPICDRIITSLKVGK